MNSSKSVLLALVLSGWAAGASAADATPVDPSTVVVPDLTLAAGFNDADAFDSYFYFHKPGVRYADALADLTECTGYSASLAPMAPVPPFAPIGIDIAPPGHLQIYLNAFVMYGLVGVAILSIVQDNMASGNARGNLRLCMSYKGYQRYGLTRALWKVVNAGPDGVVTARLALIASGPAPTAEALEP
jgi:hypothetical protein